MRVHTRHHLPCSGFTLVEMAVVLAVLALLTGGGLTVLTASQEQDRYDETVRKIERIEEALLNYHIKHGHLPCVANPTEALTSADYGVADATCDEGAAAPGDIVEINDTAAGEFWHGTVPHKTLNLPEDYGLDGWNHRISYFVIPDIGSDDFSAFDNSTDANGYIHVRDQNDNQINTFTDFDAITAGNQFDAVAYAIVSHGADKNGGWIRSGTASTCGTTSADSENCDGDVNLRDRRINNTPIDTDTLYYYDVIRWKTKSQLEFDGSKAIANLANSTWASGGQSLTDNGHVNTDSGLQFRWGEFEVTSDSATTIAYSQPFTTTTMQVFISQEDEFGIGITMISGAELVVGPAHPVTARNATGFTIDRDDFINTPASYTMTYFAIGR